MPDNPHAPYVLGSDTSEDAAASMGVHLARLERVVFSHITKRGAHGCTDEELERATGLKHQSLCARRRMLVQRGLVQDSGRRRVNLTGRSAVVWVMTGASGVELPSPPKPPSWSAALVAARSIQIAYRIAGMVYPPELLQLLTWVRWKLERKGDSK